MVIVAPYVVGRLQDIAMAVDPAGFRVPMEGNSYRVTQNLHDLTLADSA